MAEFVAVLRKTIDALEHNTPEMREKVFDKARAAIENKLAAIDPPPPAAVADRQRAALESAITTIRADYAESETDDFDDFDGIFGDDESPESGSTDEEDPSDDAVDDRDDPADPVLAMPAGRVGGMASDAGHPRSDKTPATGGKGFGALAARRPAKRNGRAGLLVAAAIALVVIGGAGYAYWVGSDRLAGLFGGSAPAEIAAVDAEESAETETESAAVAEEEAPATESAAIQPTAASEPEKFTQRLLPDGREIDEGPAGEERRIGEGTSVAAVTGASDDPPASASGAASAQLPVGHRAIFYEQSTSSAEGSAESGSVVWSLVRESPGGDAPPEAAIRAEVTIPAHGLQLRMTIRRNADRTLPAGHIVELIFLTPGNFAGGAIDNVLRVTMKETEEDTGQPLIGIPAKIADGFFLFALSEVESESAINVNLLRNQSWIDIPIVYRSGRRALMTVEKGLAGERVFDEAIDAWRQANSG